MNEPGEAELAGARLRARARQARWPRLRFSLATLVLLATIVCLAVALWSTSRRFREATLQVEVLQEEVQKYREEMGYLTISDPSKVHAIGVPALGRLKWQWRVYLPENRAFRVHAVTGGVPKEGVPAPPGTRSGSTSTMRSGELLIYAEVQKDRNGQWVLHVEEGGMSAGSATIGIHQTHQRWLEHFSGWIEQVRPGQTQAFEPGEPIVLLRLRVHEIGEKTDHGRTSGHPPEEPCDGLMIWIDQTP
jgi:hypothetical protein